MHNDYCVLMKLVRNNVAVILHYYRNNWTLNTAETLALYDP